MFSTDFDMESMNNKQQPSLNVAQDATRTLNRNIKDDN